MRTLKTAATILALLTACTACANQNMPLPETKSLVPQSDSINLLTVKTNDSRVSFVLPIEPADSDWTPFDAVRLRVANEAGNFQLNYRVDDVTSKDFATRFNSNLPLRVAQGENELEISIAALRQGNLFSRGIDVSRIKSLHLFATVKEPTTLNISDIQLIRRTAKG
ncbi:MAG: hypothetical protein FWD53_02975, partial [Phycisphaerales bacterium]|nr:hypothetical protein [Phycisphaerales bacterium]